MKIIGHRKKRERLKRMANEKKLSQGYLFSGPESIGKRLCALEFACRLVSDPDFDPTADKPYPFDVYRLQPQMETKRGITKQKSIGVEDMREALVFLARFPVRGSFRVVIVEDAHKLSLGAQNVLLKTLEEPKSTALIILITHEAGSIIPTILSRVEKIRFDSVPTREMEKEIPLLLPAGTVNDIAPFFYSLGRPGMIFRALADPAGFSGEQEKLSRLFKLSALDVRERMKLAEELSQDVPGAIRLIEWWLPGLHTQAYQSENPRYTTRFFLMLEETERTLVLLKTTQSNARLLLEKLFFSI